MKSHSGKSHNQECLHHQSALWTPTITTARTLKTQISRNSEVPRMALASTREGLVTLKAVNTSSLRFHRCQEPSQSCRPTLARGCNKRRFSYCSSRWASLMKTHHLILLSSKQDLLWSGQASLIRSSSISKIISPIVREETVAYAGHSSSKRSHRKDWEY